MSAQVKKIFSARLLRQVLGRAQPALLQLACAGMALLAARAPVFGGMYPLGLCVAAAMLAPYAFVTAVGAAAGYLLLLPIEEAAPYLAAVIAIAMVRVLTGGRGKHNAAIAPIVAGAVCYLLSGMALAVAVDTGVTGALSTLAQALLVFGMSCLLRICFSTPWQRGMTLSPEAHAALLVALMAGVVCLTPYYVLGLNLGHVAAAAAALYAALCGRAQTAAPVGVAVCAALTAANPQSLYAGFAVAVAGLAAGFFLQENRLVTALVFCGTGMLGVPVAQTPTAALFLVAELCVAGVLVYFLPQRAFFAAPIASPSAMGRATLTTLAGRLDLLAESLSAVGTTLDAVCDRLPRRDASYEDICDAVTESVCKRCPNNTGCWVEGGSEAFDAFTHLQPVLQRRGYVTPADLPAPLRETCKLPGRLTATLSAAHRTSLSRRGAEMRNRTMRAALTEQYSAMAAALACLAGQVYREEMPDKRKARRLERLLLSLGIEPLEVTVAIDAQNRLYAAVQVPRQRFSAEEQAALTQEVSTMCHCRFSPVECTHTYATTQLNFRERPLLVPLFGQCSLPAHGKVSADACKTFTDLRGCAHVLLCDGMGTGKAAAVDGNLAAALTERLLVAGFGAGEAARLVNVALSLKGDSDAGATLDAFSVNLYTGKANLFKAGAAASFLLRQNSVTVLDGDSLPIGILGSVTGRASSVQLHEGDVLIMASDGAVASGTGWLTASLAAGGTTPPQILAQRLAAEARSRAAQPDDITILCLQLAPAPA